MPQSLKKDFFFFSTKPHRKEGNVFFNKKRRGLVTFLRTKYHAFFLDVMGTIFLININAPKTSVLRG